MRKMGATLGIVLAILGPGQVHSIELSAITSDSEKLIFLHLWGPILHGDGEKFQSFVLPYIRNGYELFQVDTFSSGGDVEAAMNIGDQIRVLRASTQSPRTFTNMEGFVNCWFLSSSTPYGLAYGPTYKRSLTDGSGASWCECASACFLIWANGLTRAGNWIGIHRFKFDELFFGQLPATRAETLYADAEAKYKSYLENLDIPSSIIQRLFATPSISLYYLTKSEIELLESNPYLEELTHAKCGIEKVEHFPGGSERRDPVWIQCEKAILKEIRQSGAQAYLAKYGP
jgi:hypothetical protein